MVLVLSLCACERSPVADETPAAVRTPTETYEVRGQVVALPSTMGDLQIRHEQIPEFINFQGVNPVSADGVRGMKSMTMPFPVQDDGLLEGLAPGDKVSFTLAVDRENKGYWVSRIQVLPADTALDYGVIDAAAPDEP